MCIVDKQPTSSWSYLFVRPAKVNEIKRVVEEEFPVFIHTSTVYIRDKKRIKKEIRPSISGLVFIQGESDAIQSYLNEKLQGLYLRKDFATGKVAVIQNHVMQSFMQITRIDPTRIRFVSQPLTYYSTGNHLIKITSGILSGFEGYRIRMARDKCFVTSLGGMTAVIGGIHKESFENMDEYIRQRRMQLSRSLEASNAPLTPLQAEIDDCFFVPQNQLDVLAIAHGLSSWTEKADKALKEKDFDLAAEISLFLLERTGRFLNGAGYNILSCDVDAITAISQESERIIQTLLNNSDVSADLKEIVRKERDTILARFPFLSTGNRQHP